MTREKLIKLAAIDPRLSHGASRFLIWSLVTNHLPLCEAMFTEEELFCFNAELAEKGYTPLPEFAP